MKPYELIEREDDDKIMKGDNAKNETKEKDKVMGVDEEPDNRTNDVAMVKIIN